MKMDSDFLNKPHLSQLLKAQYGPSVEVLSVEPYKIDNSASILVTLTAQQTTRRIGHFGLDLRWVREGTEQHDRLVLKVKPPGSEIAEMLAGLANACDPALGSVYAKHSSTTGFSNTHIREVEVYSKLPHEIQPKLLGFALDQEQEKYELLIEDLSGCTLLNSVMDVDQWSDVHLHRALGDIANWHVYAKERTNVLSQAAWADTDSSDYYLQEAPLWDTLLQTNQKHFPEFYSSGVFEALCSGLNRIEDFSSIFNALPKTLIHNDANPRNACFREDGSFCLYDWELSCSHVPVYDVIELLSFVLEENRFDQIEELLDHYRKQLSEKWEVWGNDELWQQSLRLAWYTFGWHRLGMYTMAHAVAPYSFLPRVHRGFAAIGKYLKFCS